MTTPAIAEPMMRAPLIIELLRAMAFRRSSRLVILITKDCRAGISKAMTIPRSAEMAMICHGWMRPVQVRKASSSESTIGTTSALTSTVRFG